MAQHFHRSTFPNNNLDPHSLQIVLIDYQKGFDHLYHAIILPKLASFGVPHILSKCVQSLLADREQRIKIGQPVSSWVTINEGVS